MGSWQSYSICNAMISKIHIKQIVIICLFPFLNNEMIAIISHKIVACCQNEYPLFVGYSIFSTLSTIILIRTIFYPLDYLRLV